MKSSSLVRISLVVASSDPVAVQGTLQLESEAQTHFDSYCSHSSADRPFPSVLLILLTAWFERGRGRKLRFEIGPPLTGVGEVKHIEVAGKDELDDLIGNGKILSTFLRAFANVEPALTQ